MAAAASSSKWCWVVAVASCWINFCLLGVLRSSAVVYVALVDTFGVSREIAAWPSGLFSFTMCLTGGFSGCLCQYFKIRSIMMVAAILASLSVSLCYFATNIQHIVILYGAFQGIGMGLIVPLTHVIINQHFVKKRAVATGIAYAGSSAGSFVFLALTQTMIFEYGLPGTFLLLGGIMLNSVLGIALFRDPPKTCSPAASKEQNRQKVNHAIQECNPGESRPSTERKNCQIQKTKSCSSMASVCVKDEKGQSVGNDVSPTKGLVKQNDRSLLAYIMKNLNVNRLKKLKATMELALQVLCHPSFLTISLTFAVYFSSSAIFLIIIVDHALDLGNTENRAVFLVSAFSLGDLVGRLLCGWIADMKCVERKGLVTGYLVIMGILLGVEPVCHVYYMLMTLSVLLGILNGSIIVNYSVTFTENLGLRKLPMAMGFSTFIIGASGFLRPIVIGYFRDKHQSYDLLFVFLGILQIGITIVWLFESTFCRRVLQRTASA